MGVESPAGDFRICWVNTLATKLGCSRKHLTMDFGRGIWHAARVFRADCAAGPRRKLDQGGERYADQAHLTRHFGELAGNPLAAFARRKLPDEEAFVGECAD